MNLNGAVTKLKRNYSRLEGKEKVLFWIGATIGLPIVIVAFVSVTILAGVGTCLDTLRD